MCWVVAGIVVVRAVAAVTAAPMVSCVEQPEYKVTNSEGSIDVRKYDAMIAAYKRNGRTRCRIS